MPTYQYACTQCVHEFDQVQSFSDDTLTVCPACEGKLRKVYNAVGVVFKGSGFYRNDSRSPANGDAAASASNGSADSAKESSSKESPATATSAKDSSSKESSPSPAKASSGSTSSSTSSSDS